MDNRLDLASRAASPERAQGQAPRASQLGPNEVMETINSPFISRERGRPPARFDLAAEDGAGDGIDPYTQAYPMFAHGAGDGTAGILRYKEKEEISV
eukprot:7642973-Heterocapsa_arctica.AAC.1